MQKFKHAQSLKYILIESTMMEQLGDCSHEENFSFVRGLHMTYYVYISLISDLLQLWK